MALRPARTMRDPDKVAYTRKSRRNMTKNYIKVDPHKNLHHLQSGKALPDYDVEYHLVAKNTFYHRDNALESARIAITRVLEKATSGKYFLLIRAYPHHIIRENKMVSGAGADRIQKGMRRAFGKPTGRAALVEAGRPIFTVRTYAQFGQHVEVALRKASRKLSGSWKIVKAPISFSEEGA